MKRIFHLYGNKLNLGDWGSALGVRQIMGSVTDEEIEYTDWHVTYEPEIDENLVSRINNEYNAVIIGGGGLYYKKRSKTFNGRWPLGNMINISKKNLERIKVPIIIFSVGLNQDIDEKRRLFQKNYSGIYFSRSQLDNIRFINDIASLASARDVSTKVFIEDIGCSKTIHIVPCPSMFLCCDKNEKLPKKQTAHIAGINLRSDAPRNVKNKIMKVISYLQTKGFEIAFISHNSHKEEWIGGPDAKPGGEIISNSPMQLMDNYKKLYFVIGMRGHSSIFSFGALKPFVCLSYNVKVNFFAEMVGMEDYLLPINKDWSVEKFMSIFSRLMEDRTAIENSFKKLRDEFYLMNKAFARKIIQII